MFNANKRKKWKYSYIEFTHQYQHSDAPQHIFATWYEETDSRSHLFQW
jgi:hypothetical protein